MMVLEIIIKVISSSCGRIFEDIEVAEFDDEVMLEARLVEAMLDMRTGLAHLIGEVVSMEASLVSLWHDL